MANQVSGLLSPWLRRRRLRAAAPFLRGRVLDYGCGVGVLAGCCLPQAYVGVDIDEESLSLAKQQYPRYRFEKEIPEGETFDTVVALAVIEHLPMPAMFLQRCAHVLNPGGHVVLTTPHPAGDRLHLWGAKMGLFSASAHEEHEMLIDHVMMQELAAPANLMIQTYRRFLFGVNQLFILRQV